VPVVSITELVFSICLLESLFNVCDCDASSSCESFGILIYGEHQYQCNLAFQAAFQRMNWLAG
jgi:hypothetical protein